MVHTLPAILLLITSAVFAVDDNLIRSSTGSVENGAPGVQEAQAAKERLLELFKSIEGKKILSGSFGGHVNSGDIFEFSSREAEGIFNLTNKYPAVLGLDCGVGWKTTLPGREADLINCVHDYALEYARKGGIIAVKHLLPNPILPGNDPGDYTSGYAHHITNAQYARLLQEGTPERLYLYRLYDKIAEGLLRYQQEGIPVIYRPYDEPNNHVFWFACDKYMIADPERVPLYKELWMDLYHYFTNVKGLRNLIWMYSAVYYTSLWTEFYPGDEYVDMVGLNAYMNDFTLVPGYKELMSLGKTFALAEVGPLVDIELHILIGKMDYAKFVEVALDRFPKSVYFMAWNNQFSPINNLNAKEAFNNDRVINRGDFKI